MNHQCNYGGHQHSPLSDSLGRRLCILCGRAEPLTSVESEDDATDAYESADCLEDSLAVLLDMPSDGVIDERCDNY